MGKWWWGALLVTLLGVYAATDPYRLSPIVNFPDFQTHRIDMPPFQDWPKVFDPNNRLQQSEIRFLNEIHGPESLAFDAQGRGPYTGVADGRILFWNGNSWSYFAHTSPHRTEELCGRGNSSIANIGVEHICGRPLGLRFEKKSGNLYIADAYFGILVVGPEGGLATPLLSEIGGIPLRFPNDLDIDSQGRFLYFTESSSVYTRRNFIQLVFSADPTGKVVRYDIETKQASILVDNLQFPNGLSLSKDESFLVFAESSPGRLWRHWIQGPKKGTTESFAVLPGHPDNVRRNEKGEFWVALHSRRNIYAQVLGLHPRLRKAILKLPIPTRYQFLAYVSGRFHAVAVKYSESAEILNILEDRRGSTVRSISEVEEKDGFLWMGSVMNSFIAVYKLN